MVQIAVCACAAASQTIFAQPCQQVSILSDGAAGRTVGAIQESDSDAARAVSRRVCDRGKNEERGGKKSS